MVTAALTEVLELHATSSSYILQDQTDSHLREHGFLHILVNIMGFIDRERDEFA